MIQTKHTPGPWNVENGSIYTHRTDKTPIRIATMDRTGPNKSSPIECDANARLIAAAPEMLAALRLIVLQPGFEPNEPYGVLARAAIAKAEESI